MGWVIHLDHYQQRAKEAQTSDNREVAELGKLLERAVSNVADDRAQRARLFRLLELAPDDVERMEASLARHYGEPVRPVSHCPQLPSES